MCSVIKKIIVRCTIIFSLFIFSCHQESKETFISNLELFVTNVEVKSQDFSEVEWKKSDARYTNFSNRILTLVFSDGVNTFPHR